MVKLRVWIVFPEPESLPTGQPSAKIVTEANRLLLLEAPIARNVFQANTSRLMEQLCVWTAFLENTKLRTDPLYVTIVK